MNAATHIHFAVEASSAVQGRLLGSLLLLGGLFLVGCGTAGEVRTGREAASVSGSAESTVAAKSEAKPLNESRRSSEPTDEPVKVLRVANVSARLEDAARDWYGTPYKWGGSSKQGVDCSGFVKHLYEDAFAVQLPRVTETQLQAGTKVARDQIRPGDLVFFRPENDYNHVGVYVGEGAFVHASSSEGVRKSPIDKKYWTQYYWTSRRPLKPSRVPDSLTSELVAYQSPDTTVQVTDPPQTVSESGDETAAEETSTRESEKTKIASCSDSGVDCADPVASGPTASADTTLRKGW